VTPLTHTLLCASLPVERTRELVEQLGLTGKTRSRDDLATTLSASSLAALPKLLDLLPRADLKALCRACGVDDSGKEKADIIARLRATTRSAPTKALSKSTATAAAGVPAKQIPSLTPSLGKAQGSAGVLPKSISVPDPRKTRPMAHHDVAWITNFIWGIADDVLRDLFKRGKYPDVILPMCVIRRMDAVLESTKSAVLDTKQMLDKNGITEQRAALAEAADQAFYNTSKFTLRDLKSRGSQQQLLADFEDYLNGFSQNVQDILDNFKFRNQLPTLSKSDSLGTLINKFLDPEIDLSPSGIDNHAMGTVFEELVRKFNEENNEEAGEHWTPRDAVELMASLIFLPIEKQLKSGTYLLHDCACGTGGMLTGGEATLLAIAKRRGLDIECRLYGQEINPETFAICKADMLLKGEGENADHIVGGAEWSTLSHDAFPGREFDFMLANPPYGKSWKKDLEQMGGKDGMRDPRFSVMHKGEVMSLVTRSSDGQMLFLANMASKMNGSSALGSRIAEVHNGSSLFTDDAGQGESNIRRWLIENDWLEAIVALPLNLFYNTGIATYIWVLSNKKAVHRQGRVQLIDASQWFKPLRKNLGKKNCVLSPEDIEQISRTFLEFKETPESKIFPNAGFGYWKVQVERPLRLHSQLTLKAIEALRFASGDEDLRTTLYDEFGDELFTKFTKISSALEKRLNEWGSDDDADGDDEEGAASKSLPEKKKKKLLDAKTWERDGRLVEAANKLRDLLGDTLFEDHNVFRDRVDEALEKAKLKLPAADLKLLLKAVSWRVETAPPVIAKVLKASKAKADPLHGRYPSPDDRTVVLEYECDSDLRDTEQVPLLEAGGIEAFFRREVLPYTPDAWIKEDATKIGYEVSFTRHFYKPQPLRTLAEISADILALEHETEGLLSEITGGVTA
jgi:type I restriction enzyme M protein